MQWNNLIMGIEHRYSIFIVVIFLCLGILYLYLFFVFFLYVGNVNFRKQAFYFFIFF